MQFLLVFVLFLAKILVIEPKKGTTFEGKDWLIEALGCWVPHPRAGNAKPASAVGPQNWRHALQGCSCTTGRILNFLSSCLQISLHSQEDFSEAEQRMPLSYRATRRA